MAMSGEPDEHVEQAFQLYRLKLRQLAHNFNSQYATLQLGWTNRTPKQIRRYLMRVYDLAAVEALKQVTDFDSAVAFSIAMDDFSKRFSTIAAKLIRESFSPAKGEGANGRVAETGLELIARSEHWKAKAYRQAASYSRSASDRAIPRKRGRPTRFTVPQLKQALEMKRAGNRNNDIAKVLYRSKAPTEAQRRSVSTILRKRLRKPN